MAFSFVKYTYTGGDPRFVVPFPFLERYHVKVYRNGISSTTFFEWLDQGQIEITSDIFEGDEILIRRFTPNTQRLADYTDASTLTSNDLNLVTKQLLYNIQEVIDTGGGEVDIPGGGDDGGGNTGDGDTTPIDVLVAEILDSAIFQQLLERIDLLDVNAELVLRNIIDHHDSWYQSELIEKNIGSLFTGQNVAQQSITLIEGQVAQAFTELEVARNNANARFEELNQAIVTETEARVQSITTLAAQVGGNEAAIQNVEQVIVDTESALVGQITAIDARVTQNETGLEAEASRIDFIGAQADQNGARVTAVESQVASVGDDVAALQVIQDTLVTDQEATASQVTALAATVDDNYASLVQEISVVADAEQATASQVATLQVNTNAVFFRNSDDPPQPATNRAFRPGDMWYQPDQGNRPFRWTGSAWVDARDEDLTNMAALITQQVSVEMGDFGVIGSELNQIQGILGSDISAVAQAAGVEITPEGYINSNWSVRIQNQSANGPPILSGFGLGMETDPESGNTLSTFGVLANNFFIANPNNLPDDHSELNDETRAIFPFVVGQVDGVNQVGINGNLLVDGTVTADFVKSDGMQSFSGAIGELYGQDILVTNLHTVNGIIEPIDKSGQRLHIGSLDEYWMWAGGGPKTDSNAVFYLKKNGDAFFGGDVLAQSVNGQFAQYATLTGGGQTVGTSWTLISQSTVSPAPSGSSGQRVAATVSVDAFGSGTENIQIRIGMQSVFPDGSTGGIEWVQGEWENTSGTTKSFNHVSAWHSSPGVAKNVIISARKVGGADYTIGSVRGYAFGIR